MLLLLAAVTVGYSRPSHQLSLAEANTMLDKFMTAQKDFHRAVLGHVLQAPMNVHSITPRNPNRVNYRRQSHNSRSLSATNYSPPRQGIKINHPGVLSLASEHGERLWLDQYGLFSVQPIQINSSLVQINSQLEVSSLKVNGSSLEDYVVVKLLGRCLTNFTTEHGIQGGASTLGGDTYEFSCDPYYIPSGVAACSDGLWDSPTCGYNHLLAMSLSGGCATNFTTEFALEGGENTLGGDTYKFACISGYYPSAVVTCYGGQWDNQTCVLFEPMDFIYNLPPNTTDDISPSLAAENLASISTTGAATGSNKWYGGPWSEWEGVWYSP